MNRNPRRPWLLAALAAAVLALVGSVTLVAAATSGGPGGSPSLGGAAIHGPGMGGVPLVGASMMGGGTGAGSGLSMMGGSASGSGMGQVWLAGDGVAVISIASARQRAAQAAADSALHPGEVIRFDNGFYVELKDTAGAPATEVIVDPVTGAVSTEPGPAMMWNTSYGMHSARGAAARSAIDAGQAQQIAVRWLRANLAGRVAGPADTYPGYFTLETTTHGKIDGMLSVNATTGAVWPHTWHGRFLAKEDS
jgi:hypothetical protein